MRRQINLQDTVLKHYHPDVKHLRLRLDSVLWSFKQSAICWLLYPFMYVLQLLLWLVCTPYSCAFSSCFLIISKTVETDAKEMIVVVIKSLLFTGVNIKLKMSLTEKNTGMQAYHYFYSNQSCITSVVVFWNSVIRPSCTLDLLNRPVAI